MFHRGKAEFSVYHLSPDPRIHRGGAFDSAKNHKRQKPQAPTPQAPVRNRQTRKVANAKVRMG